MRPWEMPAIVVAMAVHLLPASVARADQGAVLAYGDAEAVHSSLVASVVRATVRDASWSVLDVPFSAEDREGMKACVALDRPWPCLAAAAKARGVDRIVVVRLDRYPKGFILT